jgi:hypothetical protein
MNRVMRDVLPTVKRVRQFKFSNPESPPAFYIHRVTYRFVHLRILACRDIIVSIEHSAELRV